jgi:hypothetical protein
MACGGPFGACFGNRRGNGTSGQQETRRLHERPNYAHDYALPLAIAAGTAIAAFARMAKAGKEIPMREVRLPFPELGLIAVTRAILGLGIGLLVADSLSREQRQTIGRTLLAIGALSTIPLVADVLGRRQCSGRPSEGYDEPSLASLVR